MTHLRMMLILLAAGTFLYLVLFGLLAYLFSNIVFPLLSDAINLPLFIFPLFLCLALIARFFPNWFNIATYQIPRLQTIIRKTILYWFCYAATIACLVAYDFYDAKRDTNLNVILEMSDNIIIDEYGYRPLSWHEVLAELQLGGLGYSYAYLLSKSENITDLQTATTYLKQLVEQNNPNAAYLLGVFHENAVGKTQNYLLAKQWYKLSASKGLAAGICKYGLLLKRTTRNPTVLIEAHAYLNIAVGYRTPECSVRDLQSTEELLNEQQLQQAQILATTIKKSFNKD